MKYRVTFKDKDGTSYVRKAQVVQGKATSATLNRLLLQGQPEGTSIIKIETLAPLKVASVPNVPIVQVTKADDGGSDQDRIADVEADEWADPDDVDHDRIAELERENAKLKEEILAASVNAIAAESADKPANP